MEYEKENEIENLTENIIEKKKGSSFLKFAKYSFGTAIGGYLCNIFYLNLSFKVFVIIKKKKSKYFYS